MKRLLAVGIGSMLAVAFAAPAGASDKSTAQKLVITEDDVDSSYSPEKSKDNSDAFDLIAECVGRSGPKRKVTTRYQGRELISDSQHTDITSAVDIVKSKAIAKADRAVIDSEGFPACLEDVAQSQGGSGITSVDTQRASVKDYGDYSTATLSVVEGTRNGDPVTITSIDIYIVKGRAELNVAFITNGTTPFDRADAEDILDELGKRLDKAKV
jgi:hypothetical protein